MVVWFGKSVVVLPRHAIAGSIEFGGMGLAGSDRGAPRCDRGALSVTQSSAATNPSKGAEHSSGRDSCWGRS